MNRTVTVPLHEPASDMAREEILKQVAHLSGSLRKPRIPPDGSRLQFEISAEEAEGAQQHAERLCALIQRSLRNIERKVVYRTRAMSNPVFRGTAAPEDGIRMAGKGQAMRGHRGILLVHLLPYQHRPPLPGGGRRGSLPALQFRESNLSRQGAPVPLLWRSPEAEVFAQGWHRV